MQIYNGYLVTLRFSVLYFNISLLYTNTSTGKRQSLYPANLYIALPVLPVFLFCRGNIRAFSLCVCLYQFFSAPPPTPHHHQIPLPFGRCEVLEMALDQHTQASSQTTQHLNWPGASPAHGSSWACGTGGSTHHQVGFCGPGPPALPHLGAGLASPCSPQPTSASREAWARWRGVLMEVGKETRQPAPGPEVLWRQQVWVSRQNWLTHTDHALCTTQLLTT